MVYVTLISKFCLFKVIFKFAKPKIVREFKTNQCHDVMISLEHSRNAQLEIILS